MVTVSDTRDVEYVLRGVCSTVTINSISAALFDVCALRSAILDLLLD